MSGVVTLPATPWDLQYLCRNLRRSDLYEMNYVGQALGRPSDWQLLDELRKAGGVSLVWSLWDEVGLVGCCGAVPVPELENEASVWFIGTKQADRNWRGMTRAIRKMVKMWRKDHGNIGNVVPLHMKQRLRWLRHLQFDITPDPVQIGGKSFWLFRMATRPNDQPSRP